ncbi:MAG: HlyD family efflux transporter periplasmic adaptor subunit [Pseudomonadota bacterium]
MRLAAKTDEPMASPLRMRDTSAQDKPIDSRPARRRRFVWAGVAAAVAVALIAAAWPSVQRWAASERSVALERLRLATVTRGAFLRDVSVQGTIVARSSPTLFSPAEGTLTLHVLAGEPVTEGQLLAEIYSPSVNNELARENATLQTMEIELARQKIEARKARLASQQNIDLANVTVVAAERELRRAESSWEKGVISQRDLQKAGDDYETARVEHTHAKQNAALEAETLAFEIQTRELERDRQALLVENTQRRVDDLRIVSPVDGIVGSLAQAQKAAVAANAPLLTVVDLTAFEVETRIPQNYADDIGAGLPARIRYAGQSFDGEVASVSPEVIDNTVLGRVRFAGQPPEGLRQNQRLDLRIILDERNDTLNVERGPFLDSGGGAIAYVVSNGMATRRSIRVGSSSVSRVELLSGLQEGEVIIISSIDQFEGAQTVMLSE